MTNFKPGDWVIITVKKKPYTHIIKITEILQETETDYAMIKSIDKEFILDGKFFKIEHWQPKAGEWCWFWNKYMDIDQSPKLAQFHLMVEELQKPMDVPAFYQTKYKTVKLGYLYDFCEPYIGRLPSVIKDNK